MKRKTAKELLAESFREIAETKHIDKITVKDIAENCGYSQATFYRQFKDKYDLIAWDYTRAVDEIMGRMGENGYPWKKTLLDGAKYFEEQRTYLKNLLLHTKGMDAFILNMLEIHYRHMENTVARVSVKKKPDEKTKAYIRLYCHGTVGITCEWILGNLKVSPKELAEIYERSLPQPLRLYLGTS